MKPQTSSGAVSEHRVYSRRTQGMAAPLTGPDTQSSTDQGPQVSGPESETSVSMRRVDTANLNTVTASMPPYNPHHLFTHQQLSSGVTLQQMYPTVYQTADPQLQGHYQHDQHQQGYNTLQPSSNIHHYDIESENLYQPMQETSHHHGYQGYTQHHHHHQTVQDPTHEGYSEYTNRQQRSYMQRVDDSYGQVEHQPVESRQVHRMLPRRLPHVRQRLRRRSRPINRVHNSHVNSVAADVAYSTQEHSTATSITGSVTSGPILQTPSPVQTEANSEQHAARVTTSASTVLDESSSIGENFECNICFQKANEAVVTCCGHLFCWPCLYRWLHVHSYHKECPVCKGSIAEYSITPIYGRENGLASARIVQGALGPERIPPRPAARRIESARQQREREEREREREIREAEAARERVNIENLQPGIGQVVSEIIEEEGEPRVPGTDPPSSETLIQSRGDQAPGGSGMLDQTGQLLRVQNQPGTYESPHVQQARSGSGPDNDPIEYAQRGYRQHRMALRREQLRLSLAQSRYNVAMNQMSAATDNDRRHAMTPSTTTAHLPQDWDQVVNVGRLAVNPSQSSLGNAVEGHVYRTRLFCNAALEHMKLFPGHPCIVRSTCVCRRPDIFERLNINGLTTRAITIQRLQNVKAAAWLASIHARLASLEGSEDTNSNFNAQQRRQLIAFAMAQLSQQPQEDAPNHMANPNQVSDWIINMRGRLNNIDHMMHGLEQPQQNPDGNLWTPANPEITENVTLTSTSPPDESPTIAPSAAETNESASEQEVNVVVALNAPTVPTTRERATRDASARSTRRSRRRRGRHSHSYTHNSDQGEETSGRQGPVPFIRKRRRRLD